MLGRYIRDREEYYVFTYYISIVYCWCWSGSTSVLDFCYGNWDKTSKQIVTGLLRRGVAIASFFDTKHSVIFCGRKSSRIHILDSHTISHNNWNKNSKFHAHIYIICHNSVTCGSYRLIHWQRGTLAYGYSILNWLFFNIVRGRGKRAYVSPPHMVNASSFSVVKTKHFKW